MHQIQQVSLCPSFSTICAKSCIYLSTEGVTILIGFPRTTWLWQWELCGMNFRENIANLWVSGLGRMNTSKPSLRSGFDCIIRPTPSGAGRTTPSQPGHYPLIIWTNDVNLLVDVSVSLNELNALILSAVLFWGNNLWGSACLVTIFADEWINAIIDEGQFTKHNRKHGWLGAKHT